MKKLLVASTLALLAGAAQAATLSSAFGAPDPGPFGAQVVVFDFNAATPELSGSFALVTGSGSGYAAPALDATQYVAVPLPGPNTPSSGTATLDTSAAFTRPIRSLSLYWGSIDTYNTLEFLNGANVVFTIVGGDLPPATGNQVLGDSNRRVNVDFGPGGQTITGMRFTSDLRAFEFDDIAVAEVPEPSSWALLIAGFGLVGAAARRRRMTTVTA